MSYSLFGPATTTRLFGSGASFGSYQAPQLSSSFSTFTPSFSYGNEQFNYGSSSIGYSPISSINTFSNQVNTLMSVNTYSSFDYGGAGPTLGTIQMADQSLANQLSKYEGDLRKALSLSLVAWGEIPSTALPESFLEFNQDERAAATKAQVEMLEANKLKLASSQAEAVRLKKRREDIAGIEGKRKRTISRRNAVGLGQKGPSEAGGETLGRPTLLGGLL